MTDQSSPESARARLIALMAEHAITIETVFIPWSKSRSAKPKARVSDRSLNWRITLNHDGREVYTGAYTAGIGHCPYYKTKDGQMIGRFGRITLHDETAITHETETGTVYRAVGYSGAAIKPDPVDVLGSLLCDSDAIDFATFEQWAGDFGYEADSRSAEKTYKACLEIGLALRAAFGDPLLARLREEAHSL